MESEQIVAAAWDSIHPQLRERSLRYGDSFIKQSISVDALERGGRIDGDTGVSEWRLREEVFVGETRISERLMKCPSLARAVAEADWWAAVHRKTNETVEDE